jgi:hypothetical protein
MKIESLKLANAIRVGTKHPSESFFNAEKGFRSELMPGGTVIKICDAVGGTSYTTIYNVLWFEPAAEQFQEKASRRGTGTAQADA